MAALTEDALADAEVRSEADAWIVLASATGIGPASFERLIAAFGSARTVLEAARGKGGAVRLVAATIELDDGRPPLSPEAAAGVVHAARAPDPPLEVVRRSGVTVLTLLDSGYPARLRRIGLPPPVLFARGALAALDRPRAIAIVGTRRPTDTGRADAARIAEVISSLGATVVSGLAFGVDAAAHAAAVRIGKPTVAVLGGGHDRLYPASHARLAAQILAGEGAIVSELLPDIHPTKGTFPRRNRIVSGLADATVVVEAGIQSGALTTAAWALEQGRELFVLPGRIGDAAVAGSLRFLREAHGEARIVAGVPELIEDLGLLEPSEQDRRPTAPRRLAPLLASLGPVERQIALAVSGGTAGLDELVAATGLAPATVLGALTSLEVRGMVIDAFGRFRPAGSLLLDASGPGRQRRVRRPPEALP